MNFCQKQNQKVLKRVLQSFMKLTTKKTDTWKDWKKVLTKLITNRVYSTKPMN